MEQDHILHRLARNALQKRRTEAKGIDRDLLVELET